MANSFQRCVGARLRGRHFKTKRSQRKAMRAAARGCSRKRRR